MNKIIIQNTTSEGYKVVLSVYPNSEKAFLLVNKSDVESLSWAISHPNFLEALERYVGLKIGESEPRYSGILYALSEKLRVSSRGDLPLR